MVKSSKTTDLSFNGLAVLYQIARVLFGGGDLDYIMHRVLEILEALAGMKRGAISILKPGNTELAVDVSRGMTKNEKLRGRYRLGEGVTGRVVATGKPIAVPRVSEEPTFLDKTGARQGLSKSDLAFLCVPIMADKVVVGALSVDRVATDRGEDLEGELKFVEAVADLLAQVVLARRQQSQWIDALEEENTRLRKSLEELEERGKPSHMIGNSGSMREVYLQIGQVASSQTTVLIRGETGTGKELVARAIYEKSSANKGLFITVNCAALPESLLESELFGHEKGSFTGAVAKRIGRFEAARGGTLFLDEIGEMSLSAQGKLLRAIQEKEIQRIGSTESVKVNVRLICATNRNLEQDHNS
jgi:Nif-specific regulatory protein